MRLPLYRIFSSASSRPNAVFRSVFCGMKFLVMPGLLAVAVFACALLPAQTANRITQAVDLAQARMLPNHHPLWANASNDAGMVPADQTLDHLTMVLARSPQQQAAFEQFLADQQNPVSPSYHRWLTPAEVGDRFGLSDSDIATITGWLQSQGLHVNWIAPSRIFIAFGGTAADLDRAFQTELHTYNVHAEQRMSVASDPTIPAALVPAIKAIQGLYTLDEHPLHQVSVAQSSSPELTVTNTSGTFHFIAPADFATIYDLPAAYTGAGVTIGIVSWSRVNTADLDNFRLRTGSTFANPTEVIPPGGVDPGSPLTGPGGSSGAQGEATLDVLRTGSTAPAASLLLVAATPASGGIELDAQYMVQTTPVPVQVISISFGGCESQNGQGAVIFWDSLFQQAAAEGISAFVSSGDSGAAGCDNAFAAPPTPPVPNSPNYICSSSYATCVGGTQFNDTSSPSTYWSATNSTGLKSALSYIPEGGWNESWDGTTASVAGSGGGVSLFIATPSWQTGTGVPAARSGRYTPDVSFSGAGHDGYFACFAAISGGGCVTVGSSFGFVSFAGTSASAPGMAGVAALLDQKLGGAQGNLNPGIYQTAASFPAAFHDSTISSSGVSGCSVNIPSLCNNSIPGPTGLTGGQAGFLLNTGYDEVTGLGSLDVTTFLNDFTGAVTKTTPTVTVVPTPTSITTAQSLSVAVTVSPTTGNPTPTGTVTLTIGIYTSAATTLSSGTATIIVPAGALTVGSNRTITATYSGDTNYLTNTGTSTVTVTAAAKTTPTVTVTPGSSSITTAQQLSVAVTVNPTTGNPTPTGTVTLTIGSYTSAATTLTSGSATIVVPAGMLTAGTNQTITVTYAGDGNYNSASGSSSVTVTAVAKITPTVTVTPSPTSVTLIQSFTVSVVVNGGPGNQAPSGTVSLTSGSSFLVNGILTNGSVMFVLGAGALPAGINPLTVTYTPDAAGSLVYNSATGSGTITVTKFTPTVTVTPSSSSITTAQALAVTVSFSGGTATPTGSVTLTSGSFTSAATTVSNGTAAINIPAGSLATGTDTLTASYTGDANYTAATGTATVTVTVPPPPSFTVSGTAVSLTAGATSGNTSTIKVTPNISGFTGPVTLTAAVTNGPVGAIHPPTFSFNPASVSLTGTSAGTATLTISTTATTTAALTYPTRPGARWYETGGVALACILLFCIPARRRSWRNMLGMIALLVALASGVLACGGGGGGSGGGGTTTIPGTTSGTYTITVTGTSGTLTPTGTVTLTVQ